MDVLEVSAKTVEEATQKALAQMGVSREDVTITVLSEGKSGGIFGIGAEDARIRVERAVSPPAESADVAPVALQTLQKLLTLLAVEGEVVTGSYPDETGQQPSAPLAFNIEGDDLGILIGRRGQTLAALQYIVRLIVGHQTKTWMPIVVDAEGYKQRRHEALQSLAQRMADQVKSRGAPFTLEPMPAYERRIIHMALANHPAVYTESIGEGESRKVVIRPRRPASPPRGNTASPRGNFSRTRGNSYGQRNHSFGQRGSSYRPPQNDPF